MKPWELLGETRTPDGTLMALTRRAGEYVIHADGKSLMSSRMHGSEEALATFGCGGLRGQPEPRVLIGGLGPLLLNETVKLAVVCGRRTGAAKHFRKQEILKPFPSVREGERYLQSAEPRQTVTLDRERVDALLASGRRRAA